MVIKISHNSFFDIHISDEKIMDIINTPIVGNSASVYAPVQMDALVNTESTGKSGKKGLPRFSNSQPMNVTLELGSIITNAKLIYLEIKNFSSNSLMSKEEWMTIFDISASEFNCAPNGSMYVPANEGSCAIPKALPRAVGQAEIILSYGIMFSFISPNGAGPYYGRIDPLGKVSSGGG